MMNVFDELLIKESGLVNRLLAPVRMRGVIDPIQMEADQADRDFVARTRAEVLDRSGNLDRGTLKDTQNSTLYNIQESTISGDDPIPDNVFRELQRGKFLRNKVANYTNALLNMGERPPGLVNNVMDNRNPFDIRAIEEDKVVRNKKKTMQDDFMERVLDEEEERNIKKIRTAKDKIDVMNKIMVENPNMTKQQYNSVLSTLM